jgi:hypothetical protein
LNRLRESEQVVEGSPIRNYGESGDGGVASDLCEPRRSVAELRLRLRLRLRLGLDQKKVERKMMEGASNSNM